MQADPALQAVPIVVLSAVIDPTEKVRAVERALWRGYEEIVAFGSDPDLGVLEFS